MKNEFNVIAWIFGVIFVVTILFFYYIGFFGLDSKVCHLSELKKRHVDVILNICKLESDEQILMFYSSDMMSPTSDGNLITNKGVYSYYLENEKIVLDKSNFIDIRIVDPKYGKSFLDDTVVSVTYGEEEDVLVLELSVESGRDMTFINLLNDHVKKAKGSEKTSK